jgi:hypothetical protein
LVAWNARQRQRAAGDAAAKVEIDATLLHPRWEGWDVNCDFYRRVVFAEPLIDGERQKVLGWG